VCTWQADTYTLESDKAIEVVGEGSSGVGAAQLASLYVPDFALLGISMLENAIETAESTMKLASPAKIAMLTESEADVDIVRAVEVGVVGYLPKGLSDGPHVSGQKHCCRRFLHVAKPCASDCFSCQATIENLLSGRTHVASCMGNREVWGNAWNSRKTVKYHMIETMAKLGFRTRVEATIVARQGWGRLYEPDGCDR